MTGATVWALTRRRWHPATVLTIGRNFGESTTVRLHLDDTGGEIKRPVRQLYVRSFAARGADKPALSEEVR